MGINKWKQSEKLPFFFQLSLNTTNIEIRNFSSDSKLPPELLGLGWLSKEFMYTCAVYHLSANQSEREWTPIIGLVADNRRF